MKKEKEAVNKALESLDLRDYPELYDLTLRRVNNEQEISVNEKARSELFLKDAECSIKRHKDAISHSKTIRRLYIIQITLELIILAGFVYMLAGKI